MTTPWSFRVSFVIALAAIIVRFAWARWRA
jgi:hypothetical protein